jgi:hypothetical protein
MIHYRVQNSHPLYPINSQLNLNYTLTPHLFTIQFNVMSALRLILQEVSFLHVLD